MGSDSIAVDCDTMDYMIRRNQKVFRKKLMLIGFVGSFRLGQILKYKFEIPKHPTGVDVNTYMVTEFVDTFRECLKDNGLMTVDSHVEDFGNSTIAVGYKGGIYVIEPDMQVAMNDSNFTALGMGRRYVMGCLRGFEKIRSKLPIRKKIIMALECASEYNSGVKSPFFVEYLPK